MDVTSTTGDWPLTVTLSATVAGFISVFTVAVKPTLTRMPSRITVPNPASSNFSVYSPGGTAAKRKVPVWLVVVVGVPMTVEPDSVIVTPGRTARVPSVTVPVMAPALELTVCAPADVASHTSIHPHVNPRRIQVMILLLSGRIALSALRQLGDVRARTRRDYLAHGAIRLLDGRIGVRAAGRIGVGNRDPPERRRPTTHARSSGVASAHSTGSQSVL